MTSYTPQTPSAMQAERAALLVRIGERHYGLPLTCVERVLPMAQPLPLPDSGELFMGVLNLHGQVLAVVDPHPRLGLPSPKLAAEQRLVLLHGSGAYLLWVDDVQEVVTVGPDVVNAVPVEAANPLIPNVMRLGEDMVPLLAPAALEPRGSYR